MTRAAFERLLVEAVALIPKRFRREINNLALVVEDEPSLELLDEMKRACALLERHPSRNTFDDLWMQLVTAAAQLDSDAPLVERRPPPND